MDKTGATSASRFTRRVTGFVLGQEVTGTAIVAAYTTQHGHTDAGSSRRGTQLGSTVPRLRGRQPARARVARAAAADRPPLDGAAPHRGDRASHRPHRRDTRDVDGTRADELLRRSAAAPVPKAGLASTFGDSASLWRPCRSKPPHRRQARGGWRGKVSVLAGGGARDREVVPGCHDGGVWCPACGFEYQRGFRGARTARWCSSTNSQHAGAHAADGGSRAARLRPVGLHRGTAGGQSRSGR